MLLLFIHSVLPASLQSHGLQHTRLSCPSLSPGICSKSCPLSPSLPLSPLRVLLVLNPSQHQSLFQCQRFALGGQSIGPLASVLLMNIQSWLPLGLTGLISLLTKGLSKVFSSSTVQMHQFFSAQPSLWSNSHICKWLLEKIIALTIWTFVGEVMSLLFNMLSKFVIAFLPRSRCL